MGTGKIDEGKGEIQASSYRISHGNERYNMGNTVNGIIIALYGD